MFVAAVVSFCRRWNMAASDCKERVDRRQEESSSRYHCMAGISTTKETERWTAKVVVVLHSDMGTRHADRCALAVNVLAALLIILASSRLWSRFFRPCIWEMIEI